MSKLLSTPSDEPRDSTRPGRGLRKRFLASAVLAGVLMGTAATPGVAADRRVSTHRFTEYGQVIDVQPVYKEVRTREPRQQCWTEEQQVIVGYENISRGGRYQTHEQQRHSSTGSAIVGGLIGGVIGNQLGRGHSSQSRAGATVAGAIIGGTIANEAGNQVSRHRRYETPRNVERRPIYETRSVERCNRVVESHAERHVQHYNVTYRYKGREYVTRMQRDPGRRIELEVTVAPARR